jgi:tryptophan 2,3-dioxygenase
MSSTKESVASPTSPKNFKAVNYDSYIGLSTLLANVQPLSDGADTTTYTAEHLFIVAHQTSELWLKQVLLDLDRAAEELYPPQLDLPCAVLHVGRAAWVLELVNETSASLHRLPPGHFARFRRLFGTASGAQSAQFHELARRLGLRRRHSALFDRFRDVLREQGSSLRLLYETGPQAGVVYRLAEELTQLSQAFWRWQIGHLEIVRRTIGYAPGTARTSGYNYLYDRLELPFAELWEARSVSADTALCQPAGYRSMP